MELADARKIKLEDKITFDKYLQKYPPQNSEFTFTNLFMWRNNYELMFSEWKDHLILFSYDYLRKHKSPKSERKDAMFFFPPIGPNPSEIMIEIFEHMEKIEFHSVPEVIYEALIRHKKFASLNIAFREDRNNWDYVYEAKNLIALPGNQYRQNRRWLNKFLGSYKYKFKVLTEDLIESCKKLQLEWCVQKNCFQDEGLEQELLAIYEALDNFTALGYRGAMICIDDKCAAYTFGELLNPNTLVIHVEKAHVQYEGSYQAINNLFLKNCWNNVKFVNREQDLGIDGLRRAKESYKPIYMVKKSRVYKKD